MKSDPNRRASAAIGGKALSHWQRNVRAFLPKCGAKAKGTGEPCRQVALLNGRCQYHGGRTPKGRHWHRPRWPNRDAPDAAQKLNRKLRDLERAARKREARLAAMTAQERAAFDRWHRLRPTGSPAERAARKRDREAAAEARRLLQADASPTKAPAEHDDLQKAIDDLSRQIDGRDLGIFG